MDIKERHIENIGKILQEGLYWAERFTRRTPNSHEDTQMETTNDDEYGLSFVFKDKESRDKFQIQITNMIIYYKESIDER